MLNAFQWLHINIILPSTIYFWNGSLPSECIFSVFSTFRWQVNGDLPLLLPNSFFHSQGSQEGKDMAISWLSMVYMLVYIPMIVPATWLLNHYGLRVTVLIGAALNSLGAWIKCLSMEFSQPGSASSSATAASAFPLLMVAQIICATAQVFLLSVPAQLASTWFAKSEVALATAIGVFGNQVSFHFLLKFLFISKEASCKIAKNVTFCIEKRRLGCNHPITVLVTVFILVLPYDTEPHWLSHWQLKYSRSSLSFTYLANSQLFC